MPKIVILPQEQLCPEGVVLETHDNITICDLMLKNGIAIEHACEKSCACTTCHVYVREGVPANPNPNEQEEDCLDQAWGLERDSRLSCQVVVGDEDLVVEIPQYTLNMVSENH